MTDPTEPRADDADPDTPITRALGLDIDGHRCIGTLEKAMCDPVTGETNLPGTQVDLTIEDAQWIIATIAALQEDRVRLRAEIRARTQP